MIFWIWELKNMWDCRKKTAGKLYPSKHETELQCSTNVGPPSMTLGQHWPNIGSMSRVCRILAVSGKSHYHINGKFGSNLTEENISTRAVLKLLIWHWAAQQCSRVAYCISRANECSAYTLLEQLLSLVIEWWSPLLEGQWCTTRSVYTTQAPSRCLVLYTWW